MKKSWLIFAQVIAASFIIVLLVLPKLIFTGLKKISQNMIEIIKSVTQKFNSNLKPISLELILIIISLIFCFVMYELVLRKKRNLKKPGRRKIIRR